MGFGEGIVYMKVSGKKMVLEERWALEVGFGEGVINMNVGRRKFQKEK